MDKIFKYVVFVRGIRDPRILVYLQKEHINSDTQTRLKRPVNLRMNCSRVTLLTKTVEEIVNVI